MPACSTDALDTLNRWSPCVLNQFTNCALNQRFVYSIRETSLIELVLLLERPRLDEHHVSAELAVASLRLVRQLRKLVGAGVVVVLEGHELRS